MQYCRGSFIHVKWMDHFTFDPGLDGIGGEGGLTHFFRTGPPHLLIRPCHYTVGNEYDGSSYHNHYCRNNDHSSRNNYNTGRDDDNSARNDYYSNWYRLAFSVEMEDC